MRVNTELKCECGINCPNHSNCIELSQNHPFESMLEPYKIVVWHGLGNEPTVEDMPKEQIDIING